MRDPAGRIANRIPHTTDGHRVYADALEGGFEAGYSSCHAGQDLQGIE
jgi:hypothetical protein